MFRFPERGTFLYARKEKYPKETVPEDLFAARIPSSLAFIGAHQNSLYSCFTFAKLKQGFAYSNKGCESRRRLTVLENLVELTIVQNLSKMTRRKYSPLNDAEYRRAIPWTGGRSQDGELATWPMVGPSARSRERSRNARHKSCRGAFSLVRFFVA